MAATRDLLRPEHASSEGSRLLRLLARRQTFAAIAQRLGCDERAVRLWAAERFRPSRLYRARAEDVLGIPAHAWDQAAGV